MYRFDRGHKIFFEHMSVIRVLSSYIKKGVQTILRLSLSYNGKMNERTKDKKLNIYQQGV